MHLSKAQSRSRLILKPSFPGHLQGLARCGTEVKDVVILSIKMHNAVTSGGVAATPSYHGLGPNSFPGLLLWSSSGESAWGLCSPILTGHGARGREK